MERLKSWQFRTVFPFWPRQYHPDLTAGLAKALQGFAQMYTEERQWSRAEPLYTRARDLLVRRFGPNHHSVGRILVSMGELAQELRQNSKAERLYPDAMKILEGQSDQAPLDLADLDQNLAMLYFETGRSEQSGDLFQAAIDTYRRVSPLHPNLADALRNYAGFQAAHQDFPAAENSFQEALHICEVSLGPDNSETAVAELDHCRNVLLPMSRVAQTSRLSD
jgi:tetratricopeptide (TPR) repeat protein